MFTKIAKVLKVVKLAIYLWEEFSEIIDRLDDEKQPDFTNDLIKYKVQDAISSAAHEAGIMQHVKNQVKRGDK